MAGLTRYVQDRCALLQEGTIAEQKAFIRKFVREILVKGQEITLQYTIPLPPHGLNYEGTSVLDSIRTGWGFRMLIELLAARTGSPTARPSLVEMQGNRI
jgi:hypothetical protein